MVSVALLLSLLAQAPSADAPAPPPQALLLVLDVGGDHLPAPERQGLTEALTLALARRLDLEVQSPRSLMDRINFAEQQQQVGCDSSACMAEIANAMGARFVVFSRVVQLGDEQVLRADVYDNRVGRSLALAAVQAGSAKDLTRRLPGLVDELVKEAHGDLPVRAVARPVEVPGDVAMTAMARAGYLIGGAGLGTAVVFGAVFGLGAVQSAQIRQAADAYADAPTIDNARSLIDARGPFDANTRTFGTCASGCVGVGGLLAFLVGAGLVGADALAPAAGEAAP